VELFRDCLCSLMWHDNKRDIKYSYLLTGDEEMDRGALKRIVNADLESLPVVVVEFPLPLSDVTINAVDCCR